jgi:hypothetical protein
MTSMAPAAPASRSHRPWQMVIDLADVGNIGEPSVVSMWESRVKRAAGEQATEAWQALARACP